MGASVIPFSILDGKVYFLFHKTFSGRRAGCLVDFGGGGENGESAQETAIREFIEETESMYFSEDPANAVLNEKSFQLQAPVLESLFERTLSRHPDWWCARDRGKKDKDAQWRTFFIEFDYKDPMQMNLEWEKDSGERFKKRRELLWISSDLLLDIYTNAPEQLWKRLRQLKGVENLIQKIVLNMTEQKASDQ